MGWSIGFDTDWNRDIGYAVPAYCDHPECDKVIDRGLSYVCAGEEPRGGDGCGLYFCEKHKGYSRYTNEEDDEAEVSDCCERCRDGKEPFDPKLEHPHWAWWKLNSGSWKEWREELSDDERLKWKAISDHYNPTEDDIEEAKEDE